MELNEKRKYLQNLKYLSLSLCLSVNLSGCGKKSDCEIDKSHVHLYVNEEGYKRYIPKEYLKYDNFYWNEENYLIDEDDKKFYDFLDSNNLLKISDNLELILKKQTENIDHIEYEYSYNVRHPHTMRVGKVTTTYYTHSKKYDYTDNPEHENLTGKKIKCTYLYTAYKITKNKKGKYILVASKDVKDLREVMDEYPYIKEKYYKKVNVGNLEEIKSKDCKIDNYSLLENKNSRILALK